MKEVIESLVVAYLVIMSVVGFATMGIDKKRAIKREWRISECILLLIAFTGGGIGSFLGMNMFRHKTKHMKFVILLPLTAILYAIFAIQLIINLI